MTGNRRALHSETEVKEVLACLRATLGEPAFIAALLRLAFQSHDTAKVEEWISPEQ